MTRCIGTLKLDSSKHLISHMIGPVSLQILKYYVSSTNQRLLYGHTCIRSDENKKFVVCVGPPFIYSIVQSGRSRGSIFNLSQILLQNQLV